MESPSRIMKKLNQKWWTRDIEIYMRFKDFYEKQGTDFASQKLARQRVIMVERYGEAAMRGI